MRKLRKRKIAKCYGIKYKSYPNKKTNKVFHYFKVKRWSIGFYGITDKTFLTVVRNQDKWGSINFKYR